MIDLERAIEEETHRVKPMVCSKVMSTDVDDVMQDIRLSFFVSFPRFREESKLSTYAHGIAKRKIADYIRGKYRRKKEVDAAMGIPQKVQKDESKLAVASLTVKQGMVFRMVGQGLKNTDIAKTLCMSTNTVRSHLKIVYLKLQCRNRVMLALLSHEFFKEKGNEN